VGCNDAELLFGSLCLVLGVAVSVSGAVDVIGFDRAVAEEFGEPCLDFVLVVAVVSTAAVAVAQDVSY
jgi:hypothetical protein